MATRKTRKPASKKKAKPKKTAKRATPARKHKFTQGIDGWITHTDLASADPAATKAWCSAMFGWTFMFDVPAGPGKVAHMFRYSDKGGGAVRPNNPPEIPGSIPYVHVADAHASYRKALDAGAEVMLPPMRVMDGVTIAIVRAPGGVPVGLSGP